MEETLPCPFWTTSKMCSVVKSVFNVSRGIFLWSFFLEKLYFFMIFVFWANFFSFLLKEFPHYCQNRIPHVHRKPWKKITFFEKIVDVLTVFTMSERLSALWRKLFGRVVKTAFEVSMGSYWKGIFEKKSDNFYHSRKLRKCFSAFSRRFSSGVDRKKLSKFLIISGHWVKNFRLFVRKIEPGLPELLSTCLQEQFERYIFLKKKS